MGKAAGDVVQGRNGWLGDPAPTSPGLAPASLNLGVGFRPRPASLCHWVLARGWGECPQALRGLREPQQHLNSEGAHCRHPLDRRPASVSPAADMSSCQAASGRPETVVLNTTGAPRCGGRGRGQGPGSVQLQAIWPQAPGLLVHGPPGRLSGPHWRFPPGPRSTVPEAGARRGHPHPPRSARARLGLTARARPLAAAARPPRPP